MTIKAVTHVGICVSDLDRSIRFYTEALGFVLLRSFSVSGPMWGRVMEVDDLAVQSRILRRDGMSIELLAYDSPGVTGDATRRPMNRLGFTHLAVWVEDLDVAMATVREHGGHVIDDTLTVFDQPDLTARWVYCTDPDGVRVELIENAAWRPAGLEP